MSSRTYIFRSLADPDQPAFRRQANAPCDREDLRVAPRTISDSGDVPVGGAKLVNKLTSTRTRATRSGLGSRYRWRYIVARSLRRAIESRPPGGRRGPADY
jgi:hypothetical protein